MSENPIQIASDIIVYTSAVICVLVVTFIVFKVNKRIPLNFGTIISLYSIAIVFRAISSGLLQFTRPIKSSIEVFCVSLIELTLAYFIFQILAFKNYLTAENPEDLKKITVQNKIMRNIVLSILFLSGIAKIYLQYELISRQYINFNTGIKITLTITLVLRQITLLFLITSFALIVWFFTVKKFQIMKIQGKNVKFTKQNYLITGCICLMMAVRLSNYLTTNIISIIVVWHAQFTTFEIKLMRIMRGLAGPLMYIIELLLICYLIYYQDQRNQQEQFIIKKQLKKETDAERLQEAFFLQLGMDQNIAAEEAENPKNNNLLSQKIGQISSNLDQVESRLQDELPNENQQMILNHSSTKEIIDDDSQSLASYATQRFQLPDGNIDVQRLQGMFKKENNFLNQFLLDQLKTSGQNHQSIGSY